jgi:hypothetical protein
MYIYIYKYMYIHIYIHVYIYVYIYLYRALAQRRKASAEVAVLSSRSTGIFLDLLSLFSHAFFRAVLCVLRTHRESRFCNPHVVIFT